jgi:hypothetical protein
MPERCTLPEPCELGDTPHRHDPHTARLEARTPRVVVKGKPSEMSRETHDQAQRIIEAACAEIGYPIESVWVGYAYSHKPFLPLWVLNRARRIAFDALGIPYHLEGYVSEDPYGDAPPFDEADNNRTSVDDLVDQLTSDMEDT